MDKNDFVLLIKSFKNDVTKVTKDCKNSPGKQIQSKDLLKRLELIATTWFESIDSQLRSIYPIEEQTLLKYREPFGKLLELVDGKPSKMVVQMILDSITKSIHADILVPVQMHKAVVSKYPNLDIIITHATGLEIDYLTEAIECARLGKNRAAIILGWCAAVNRLHIFIEKEGFSKFSQASIQMLAIQTGRYKRFNKKFDIYNLSDLRMTVFDGDLLWVLEFMGAIDGNQHERLEICFTMRNTCAHPGDAIFSEENVLSFFSDIDSLIFSNPKFALAVDLTDNEVKS